MDFILIPYLRELSTLFFRSCCRVLFFIFFSLALVLSVSLSFASEPTIKIGVLAYRGSVVVGRMWTPTADYLARSIPGYQFEIVPLDFNHIDESVRSGKVDFVIVNTEIYVDLEAKYGINRIATLQNMTIKGPYTLFGGVIFRRADRNDIQSLQDLKGKKFMAVQATSFGGWNMAWRELKEAGIDPYRDFNNLSFGGTHDAVVFAVRDNKVDVGTVRSDTLERMSEEGKINITDYVVINRINPKNGFPFAISTRLYPEWPFAKVSHTSDELAKKVAISLFNMPMDDPAAISANAAGWTIPLDYQPVHDLMKELHIGAYKDYGKVTLSFIIRQYGYWLISILLLLLLMTLATIYVVRINRILRKARIDIEKNSCDLEIKVGERTDELKREIEERKRTENALRESEEQYRSLVENINIGVYRSAVDQSHFIQANSAMAMMFGYDSVEGFMRTSVFDLYQDSGDRQKFVKEICENGFVKDRVLHFQKKDGTLIWCSVTAATQCDSNRNQKWINGIIEDVTEKRKLEEQLRQSQKMEAIGTLAGGVAHDFNNILTAIIGFGNLLKIRLSDDSQLNGYIDNILYAAEKATKLTRSLLAFSRKQLIDPRPVNLNDIVSGVDILLRRVIGEDIEFKTLLVDEDLIVMADKSQIEQVLLNLATNARDAMPDGGIMTLKTEKVLIDGEATELSIQPGAYGVVSLSDTGIGFDSITKQKIFEPFFTTKEVGKGTGLGLSMAYGIIKQHNGEINVYSEPGKGTIFRIYLRLIQSKAEAIESAAFPLIIGGSETILVVEDNEDTRKFIRQALEDFGYTVIEAVDGEDAISVFVENMDKIQMIIIDIIMPKKNGKEAYDLIRRIKDDIPVIFTSGYAADIINRKGILEEGTYFISKPFSPHSLLSRVREALDQSLK